MAPKDASWDRVRRASVASDRKRLYCFDKLGLSIQVENNSEHVLLQAAKGTFVRLFG